MLLSRQSRLAQLGAGLLVVFLVGACSDMLPALGLIDAEATLVPTLTATVVPTLTPLPTRKPTRTPLPAPTASPTPLAITGAVLTKDNIAAAQSAALTLPFSPGAVFWPGGEVLLARADAALQRVALAPLGLGTLEKLDLPGRILAISPDGGQVLTQAGDGGVQVWDRAGRTSAGLNFGAAYFGAFSEDGRRVILGSPDTFEVTLFDAGTRKALQTLSGFVTAAPVYNALLSPTASQLAWVARNRIQFQDVASGQMENTLTYEDSVFGLDYSPDGRWLLVTARGLLQAVTTGPAGSAQAVDLAMEAESPLSAVFSPDGSLVAAGVGSRVVVWETGGWTRIAELPHEAGQVRLVSFSPDGRILVSFDDQNQMLSWRLP